VINARHVMYSASIASHLAGIGPAGRLGLSYLLTDRRRRPKATFSKTLICGHRA